MAGLHAGEQCTVRCIRSSDRIRLWIDELGPFEVASDGSWIGCRSAGHVDQEHLVTGPPLALALAQRGVFCLHASAVDVGEGAAVFLGESGVGKSTLAGLDPLSSSWRRIADDILPVTLGESGPIGLPSFPQLKLGLEEAMPTGTLNRLPLAAFYVLQPADGSQPTQQGVALRPLSPAQGALALVGHTVAARLFDRQQLVSHSETCASIAEQTPGRALVFPRVWDALPRTREVVLQDILQGKSA